MNLSGIQDPNIALAVAIASTLIAFLSIYFTFRSSNRKTDSDAKTALDARIDARVAEQLAEAWEEIRTLKGKVESLEAGEVETRRIVRQFFQRLMNWDRRGRHGRMPMPTHDELERLGVADLAPSDTGPTPGVD